MQLDGDLADAQFEGYLFVEAALCHLPQDFALARRQFCVAVDVLFDKPGRGSSRDILLDPGCDRVKERLVYSLVL